MDAKPSEQEGSAVKCAGSIPRRDGAFPQGKVSGDAGLPGKGSKRFFELAVPKPTQVGGYECTQARELNLIKELGKLAP